MTRSAAVGNQPIVDVAVVGAGVVGAAIARELAGTRTTVAVVDGRADVGDGTSKANTAILHTGFDATPGTLESRLVARGYHLLGAYAETTGIPVERTGALLVAWTDEELATLPELRRKAETNGYTACEMVDADGVHRRVPRLGEGARGGMTVPGESITCTWTTTLALATDATRRGARLLLDRPVTGARVEGDHTVLETPRGEVRARWVVNAAGLGADVVDRFFGHDRFTVTPRRGELLVFDKLARADVPLIVLPVPSAAGKGVLVSPTVYGNVMLGPTAEDLDDKTATGTSEGGLAFLLDKGRRLMPHLLDEEVTAAYAGLRAAVDHGDYLVEVDVGRRYVVVGGIRSTGLTAGMAVAEHVRAVLADAGFAPPGRDDLPPPPRMPNLGEAFARPYQDAGRIAADAAYGTVVCFCERVTAGEIRDALGSDLPPSDLDGLRRRTRVMNGRCQGFFCGARVRALLADHRATPRERPADDATTVESAHDRPARSSTGMTARPPIQHGHDGPDRRDTGTTMPPDRVAVAIVGGGPAGLTAAAALAPHVDGRVLVIDREAETGGIPRHSDHLGYGIRDLRRVLSGPAYARRLSAMARDAGAVLETQAMVTGWAGDRRLEVTSPRGRRVVEADAVVLATGARERPRAARWIPGDRPDGVYTTGELQNLVHVHRAEVGQRAVVVGAELVSWSAVLTLREAGCSVAALVSAYPRSEAYTAFSLPGRAVLRATVVPHSRLARIDGRERVRSVEIEDLRSGRRRRIECDTVVMTGDWVPDHELPRLAGLDLDAATRGPVVDTSLASSRAGVFAAGNVVHPVDTADGAALDGRHVAVAVRTWLHGAVLGDPPTERLEVRTAAPLRWVTPQLVLPGVGAPRGQLLTWTDEYHRLPVVRAVQAGTEVGRARVPWPAAPGRIFRVPERVLVGARPGRGPVTLHL
ncbi:MAG: FAD-dependent oxidoreductase [Phycicoccus sp.]